MRRHSRNTCRLRAAAAAMLAVAFAASAGQPATGQTIRLKDGTFTDAKKPAAAPLPASRSVS